MSVIIKIKRGTTTQWINSLQPLSAGELGYDISAKVIKIGDGYSLWSGLQPMNKFEISEIAQDAIYEALTDFVSVGNNITVEYNDVDNYIVLDVGPNVVLEPSLTAAISGAVTDANEYTDAAVAGLGNSLPDSYVPISDVGAPDGVAQLVEGYVPDSQISPSIARDSELFSGSYNDLSDKPNIALAAVQWTPNHYLLPGGENTRYLAGDIVYDGGNIYVANYDNESLPTTNTQYWSSLGSGKRLNIDGRDIPNITYDQLNNKPTLFDGSYLSLTNQPTLFSGSYDDLTGKPNLFSGAYEDLTGEPDLTVYSTIESPTFTGTVTTDDLIVNGDFTVNGTNFAASATSITIEDNLVQLAHTNPANTVDLGLIVAYNDGATKHAGIVRDVSDDKWKLFKNVSTEPTTTVAFGEGSLDSLAVGDFEATSATIGNVSNTELQYLNGVSSSIQTQLDAKAPIANPIFTGTVSGITKDMIGLGNVDNTSDATKYGQDYSSDTAQSKTLSSSTDKFKVIEFSNSGAISVTIPNDTQDSGWEIGSSVELRQVGTGQITVGKDAAVTLNAPDSQFKTRVQWSSLFLEKRAANTWLLTGDTTA
jgi:hypothetical protein